MVLGASELVGVELVVLGKMYPIMVLGEGGLSSRWFSGLMNRLKKQKASLIYIPPSLMIVWRKTYASNLLLFTNEWNDYE
jgi:hypothetical protein